jgi:hypothetical protein
MTTALIPVSDLDRMATAVAASKLFGMATKEQALALMLVAQAEGLHPATAARDYHIIQGRPALKADAMLARYLNSGGKVTWHDHTDTKVSATFSHPAGGELTIDWDMERAKKAGLGGKDMWAKYPRQMLRARVISEGIRATNPAVATGIYTPEEMQDIAADRPARRGRGPSSSPRDPSAPAERDITDEAEVLKVAPEQIEALKKALVESKVDVSALLEKAGLTDISEIPSEDCPKAILWIKSKAPKAA